MKSYQCLTLLDKEQNIVFRNFSDRVDMTFNIETNIIKVFKDGNEVSCIDASELTIAEYECLLDRTANEAKQLREISNNN